MSSFPEQLPPRPEGTSLKDRTCPNARGCWNFSWSAFSLAQTEPGVLLRRICMWTILLARTALSVLSVIHAFGSGSVDWAIVNIILGILVFFFIAWCLAMIGEATGRRKVLGITIGRWALDIILLVFAAAHVGLLIGAIFGLGVPGLSGIWILLWLLLFGVAWVCTWAPEPESYA